MADQTDRNQGETCAVVLIVDDSVTNLHLLNAALKERYRVKAARRGIQALRIAAAERPDLILLDVMMPEMDGPEVCRRLKANPVTADIPVLFLSGTDKADEHANCMHAGGVEVLVKPIPPEVLVERVAANLRLRH